MFSAINFSQSSFTSSLDKLLDYMPDLIEKTNSLMDFGHVLKVSGMNN